MNHETLFQLLSDYTDVPQDKIMLDTRLDTDLGLNSMDFVILLCEIENLYNLNLDDDNIDEAFSSTYTVEQLIDIIEDCM